MIAHTPEGSGLPTSTWFLGPTQVHTPNVISIGSAVLAQLMGPTDFQTTEYR